MRNYEGSFLLVSSYYDIEKFVITNLQVFMAYKIQYAHNCSVADPDLDPNPDLDPPDPRVFGPPGSGSGS
jgi:hypothetical protein